MITTYLDKGCKALNSSQDLKISNDCSALWFCVEKGSDASHFLRFMISTFNSFVGLFWLAFSGGVGSTKILDLKRSFGHWLIAKDDILARNDSLDQNGDKLYSDIAQIGDGSIDAFAAIINRNLFGIDSAVFFLPAGTSLPSNDIVKPLTDLLIKRNAMNVIDEKLLNQGFFEKFIADVVALEGIATVTLRDSNMCTMVVAVGSQFVLGRIAKSMESSSPGDGWQHINSEAEFRSLLGVGVSVSAFS